MCMLIRVSIGGLVALRKPYLYSRNLILTLRLGHTGERICNGGQTDKNVQNLLSGDIIYLLCCSRLSGSVMWGIEAKQ